MTRQELEDRLLDYLYDELEPSERSAFERALPAHPEVLREVAAHRATRKAYQALPRATMPAGLLDTVLAEADAEAARRSSQEAPAPAPVLAPTPAAAPSVKRSDEPVSFWERVRRVLFQPTFAMAMVVLVVAGVSLVATRKGELPGMPAANDAQSLPAPPPVTVARSEPTAAKLEERDRAAALEAAGALAVADEKQAVVAAPALDPAPKPEAEPAARGGGAPAVREAKNDLAGQGAVTKNAPEAEEIGGADGTVAAGVRVNEPPPRPITGDSKVVLDGLTFGERTNQPGDDRRDRNVPDDAVRRPAEAPPGDLARESPAGPTAPTTPKTESAADEHEDFADKRPANEKGKTGPAKVAEERGSDEPKPDAYKDVKPTEPKPADAPAPSREVTRTDGGRVATIDDDATERKKAEPSFTPPAPTPAAVWQTYQQQLAAGAYADAQRSIEQLAKLEGETPRVREARAELSRRRAQTPTPPPAANRVPPDPPVQPPK